MLQSTSVLSPPAVASSVVFRIAQALLDGFDKHYRLFRECSRGAKRRFEQADWDGVQRALRERIQFYDLRVNEAVARLEQEFHAGSLDDRIWQHIKLEYIRLLTNHKQPECAETFFNSVCCKILHREYFRNDFIFVRPAVATDHIDCDPPSYRCYYPGKSGLRAALAAIVGDFKLKRPFTDLHRDLRYVLRMWRMRLPRPFKPEPNCQMQVLSALFYRNKGAYLVGKLINGNHEYPFVVPILHDQHGGLYLDTVLLETDQLDVLFSSSRAYFMADIEAPSAYVQFLRGMMPNAASAELYTMLGLQKHGKTLFYRDFLHHLKHSGDDFVIAPGIKGLVMLVFTLPSFPYVFKVIKDVISRPKEVTREIVKEKYLLVKYHDRVGRMADTLEFSDVAFPKSRCAQPLLAELRALAPSVIEEDGDTLIIKHVYIERRMTPLNIYLDGADDQTRKQAIESYGDALKQLAAANIFAGDLWFKNFGVTRYGRVVFYDYDEIDYLTNCNFRRIPPPPTEEDEFSADAWYTVNPNDVFPEEFGRFLLTDARDRACFLQHHKELLDAEFWKATQQRIAAGHFEDVFPYSEALRFRHLFGRGSAATATATRPERKLPAR
jgi:isocitrate dehydrogenase kinase/phosphatase